MTSAQTIQSIREGLLKKEFSAVEIAREALVHAERENPKTNAYLPVRIRAGARGRGTRRS